MLIENSKLFLMENGETSTLSLLQDMQCRLVSFSKYPFVLVLSGVGLIFFTVSNMGLCFGERDEGGNWDGLD